MDILECKIIFYNKKLLRFNDRDEPQLDQGLAQLDQGLAQLDQGLAQLNQGLTQLNQGLTQLNQGLTQLDQGWLSSHQSTAPLWALYYCLDRNQCQHKNT